MSSKEVIKTVAACQQDRTFSIALSNKLRELKTCDKSFITLSNFMSRMNRIVRFPFCMFVILCRALTLTRRALIKMTHLLWCMFCVLCIFR